MHQKKIKQKKANHTSMSIDKDLYQIKQIPNNNMILDEKEK